MPFQHSFGPGCLSYYVLLESGDLENMEFWPEFLAGSFGREFIAGGVGGMAGVIAGHPLDTLRIHLQQPRMGSSNVSNSAFSLIRRIHASGGSLAFFKGMGAPLASVPFQNAVAFQTYALFSRALSVSKDEPPSYERVAVAGFGAGLIQTSILTPVELIKIRLQLYSSSTRNRIGPLTLARMIARAEGLRGLYRGLGITILRDAPAHAVYFGSYEYMRERLHRGCRKSGEETLVTMLTAGGIAGVASWMTCYPLDVLKSRLQAQGGPGRPYKYAGIADCLHKSVQEEGISVLWRGLGTAISRAFLVNGAIFSAYEICLRFMPPEIISGVI